ncbi:MAG TPA: asparaginase, partial [Gaiellaceae bacterium]|nr:asparaginase [Gaiellaceae bacterium]
MVIEATRSGAVEARHRVHAVAVTGGEIVEAVGDPQLVTYLRSSAKPLQALPLVRARPDLDGVEIAIACASHLARPEQLAAVRRLLAAAPAEEGELECGPEPTPIEHNCSGKHAGMLALALHLGAETSTYDEPANPVQLSIVRAVAQFSGVPVEDIAVGIDGCGVPTFG